MNNPNIVDRAEDRGVRADLNQSDTRQRTRGT